MGKVSRIGLMLVFLFSIGCTSGHCRRQEGAVSDSDKKAALPAGSVQVYKYDGSKQCGMGKGTTLESMGADLKDIKILKQEKKPDGLMHVQVCGSNTGMANVYTIPESDLQKAEGLGFKKWSF